MRLPRNLALLPALALALAALTLSCGNPSQPPTPECSVSPSPVDFGTINVGDSARIEMTVTNVGTGTLAGSIRLVQSTEYRIVGPSSYSLGAGQTARFPIVFRPVSPGHRRGVLDMGSSECGHYIDGASSHGIQATGCGWNGTPCHSHPILPQPGPARRPTS